ncbi:SGNH/GDSL hydrolase family protein [Streptomyces sp. NPDC057307]|uniref:SGNH/GDSL hydrolase family protein n=1 Tax=Streptomyces sp. NPDC057307 TaxID=3346096 RepID=UPI00363C498B
MNLEDVALQGKEYERVMAGDGEGFRWLPYLMFHSNASFDSPVVHTDAGGFRISHGPSGPRSLMGDLPEGPVSVLLGGSPAFGLGASCDEETVASHLAAGPDSVPWLNLACSGFNSTQELITFLLHRHQLPVIKDIVVMSGLNNLVLAGLPKADNDYGQFFYSGEFARRLGLPELEQPESLLDKLAKTARRVTGNPGEPEVNRVPEPAERLELAVRIIARDLDRLAELAAPTGARIHFALQPVSTWTRKPYTAEERQLLQERGGVWDKLFSLVLDAEVHEGYGPALEAMCKERDIAFLDLNRSLGSAPAADNWLFVDSLHLTDEGYRTVADAMRSDLDLAGAPRRP